MAVTDALSNHRGKLFVTALICAGLFVLFTIVGSSGPHLRAGPGAAVSSPADALGKLTAAIGAITGLLAGIGQLVKTFRGDDAEKGSKPPPPPTQPFRREQIIGYQGDWIDIDLLEFDGTTWRIIDRYRKHRSQPKPAYLG
ncbi:hypothetical protein [Bradyrhizobium sp. USDA 3364]